jgi:hypothetical protein
MRDLGVMLRTSAPERRARLCGAGSRAGLTLRRSLTHMRAHYWGP